MHRRIWIKQIILSGGAILFVPCCTNDKGAVSVALNNISITSKEEMLLAEVSEAIIPETNTPGAKALNIHQFVLKMIDDCYDKPEQERIIGGLQKLNTYSRKSAGSDFSQLNQDKKLSLLREVGSGESFDMDIKFFLSQTRKWVIKGYDTSEYVLIKLVPYQLVPGHFNGCVRVNKAV